MNSGSGGPPQPVHLDPSEWRELPAEVYVPIQPPGPDDDDAQLELRANGSGQSILPAYTTLESLGAALGAEQTWMQILSSRIPQLAEQADFVSVLVDAAMPCDTDTDIRDGDEDGLLYVPSRPYSEGDAEALLDVLTGDVS